MSDQVFCTLFDSNYLDKGIVLYKSMEEHLNPNFKLYVFAFDDITERILKKENYSNMIVVSLQEFETSDLLKVKAERSRAEYCWTCTAWIIKYVIEKYNEYICTYIDADMMFFGNPQVVFDEMRRGNYSTAIVPHRFKSEKEEEEATRTRGKYCVEFNTFFNTESGMEALNWWAQSCLNWCFYAKPGTTEWYGDQKYLNVFKEKFDGVYVCDHFGVGLAPWNIDQVDLVDSNEKKVIIRVRKTGVIAPVIIYHFESLSYLTKRLINTHSRKTSRKMHDAIYNPYCEKIVLTRKMLESKYNLTFSLKRRTVTKNPLMKIYQTYLSPFRHVRRRTDLYWVKEK